MKSPLLSHLRRLYRQGAALLAGGLVGSSLGVWGFAILRRVGQIDLVIDNLPNILAQIAGGIAGSLFALEYGIQRSKVSQAAHGKRRMASGGGWRVGGGRCSGLPGQGLQLQQAGRHVGKPELQGLEIRNWPAEGLAIGHVGLGLVDGLFARSGLGRHGAYSLPQSRHKKRQFAVCF